MYEFSGYMANNIIRSAVDRVFYRFDLPHAERIQLWERSQDLLDKMLSQNIRIQSNEPFLILWNTSREHEGQVYMKTEQAKIGRWVSRHLASSELEYTDADVEKFVDFVKAEVSFENTEVEIITGAKIRDAYDEANYGYDCGDMSGSCMRYAACQDFFDIYTANPKTVGLATIRDGQSYVARALIWTDVNGQRWIDRIYANRKNQIVMKDWAEKNDIKSVYEGNFSSVGGVVVALEEGDFAYYPYMDSLQALFYNSAEATYYLASSYDHNHDTGSHWADLTCTTGGPFNEKSQCEECGDLLDDDYNSYCDSCNEYFISCEVCESMTHADSSHRVEDTDVCDYCYMYECSQCDSCGEHTLPDGTSHVEGLGDLCSNCEEKVSECVDCSEGMFKDDLDDNGRCDYCSNLADREEEEEEATPVYVHTFTEVTPYIDQIAQYLY